MAFTTADMDALAARIRAKREPQGLNVSFTREDGAPDSFSFGSKERADRFSAKMAAAGRLIPA